nr:hypothetical protein [Chromobacterium phragmitis]
MSWLRDNLRWLALLALALCAIAAGAAIWLQRLDNARLRERLDAGNAQRDALHGQLQTAQQTIAGQDAQIGELAALNRQQAADAKRQLQLIDAITRRAATRAAELEATLNEDQDAKRWGDTRLPDAVARLLDAARAAGDPAGAPDPAASLRAGDGMPAAGRQPENQPPASANAAGGPSRP